MDVVRAIKTSLWIPKSEATWALAGATIEEETGLMKVNADTTTVAAHLRPKLQLHENRKLGKHADLVVRPTF
jgi:hypothetical protein